MSQSKELAPYNPVLGQNQRETADAACWGHHIWKLIPYIGAVHIRRTTLRTIIVFAFNGSSVLKTNH